jgi:hypothetical protein
MHFLDARTDHHLAIQSDPESDPPIERAAI